MSKFIYYYQYKAHMNKKKETTSILYHKIRGEQFNKLNLIQLVDRAGKQYISGTNTKVNTIDCGIGYILTTKKRLTKKEIHHGYQINLCYFNEKNSALKNANAYQIVGISKRSKESDAILKNLRNANIHYYKI